MDEVESHPTTVGLDQGTCGDRHPPTRPGHAGQRHAANPGDHAERGRVGGYAKTPPAGAVRSGAEVVPCAWRHRPRASPSVWALEPRPGDAV